MIKNSDAILNEFELAYKASHDFFQLYLTKAESNARFKAGDQWSTADKDYLTKNKRNVLVFNQAHKILKLIAGYQRKNRLALKVDPIEMSDSKTASQFSALLMYIAQYSNMYNIMSDGFESSLATGLSLVNIYMDYSEDWENGDIKFKLVPYNKFLLDPNTSQRDLSDCEYVLRREYISKDAANMIVPGNEKMIEELGKMARDNKYSQYTPAKNIRNEDLLRYDEMYLRTFKDTKYIVDAAGGREPFEWTGTEEDLKLIMQENPSFKVVNRKKPTVELRIMLNDKVVHKGSNPDGLDDFPYIPEWCYFEPEINDAKYRIRSVVDLIKDPQVESNKRISKMLDLIDNTISSGKKIEEGALVKQSQAYQTGQNVVLWAKQGKLDKIQDLQRPDIPQGIFQLNQVLGNLIMEIPGANSEMLGAPANDSDIPASLAKIRTAAGLVVMQDIFDNYRLSKKNAGKKMIKMIQANWGPEKIQRIIGEGKEVSPEFYDGSFGKYDCVPTEGVLSDSQFDMNFRQLLELRQIGIQVPDSLIVANSRIEGKEELQQALAQQEQSMQKQQEINNVWDNLQKALMMKVIEDKDALASEKNTQAFKNRTSAILDVVKQIKEIRNMDSKEIKDRASAANLIMNAMRLANIEDPNKQGQPGSTQEPITTPPQTTKPIRMTRR